MLVNKIQLENFRNYTSLECVFQKGINFIIGDNAKGKTNIVEAIGAISNARSFRTSETRDMIKNGEEKAKISARLSNDSKIKNVEIDITTKGKKIRINNEICKKVSDLTSLLKVFIFSPKDTTLLKDAPKNRRDFLNSTISQYSESYLRNLIQYEKILKERNEALKEFNINKVLLDILRDQLINLNWLLFKERVNFIQKLNKILEKVYPEISLTNESLRIKYLPVYKLMNREDYVKKAKEDFINLEREEFVKRTTLIGVHKEDFEVYLNEKEISKYGSQSENRMAVLVLKIAPYFMVNDIENRGVVILDDVLSELDKKHEENLLNYLENLNQVFITNTEKSEFYRKNYYIVDENSISMED